VGLIDDAGPGPIALDAVAFIYFIEEHQRFFPLLDPIFAQADHGLTIVTSALTLHEVLVVPIRIGNSQLTDRYEWLLTQSQGIHLVDVTREQLVSAARLRAAIRIKTPDALQVVAAMSAGCTSLITNDRRLPIVPGLNVIQLESYV
jgi:predicted nucleic acid-binding protein